jgi:PIN domain nuclease of toxin-antitoxin system
VTEARRLLLDTHVFLWWRGEPARLPAALRSSIATSDVVFVSAVSAWEAAIKSSLGRLDLPDTFEAGVLASRFEKLLLTFAHAERVGRLPHHHRDPFDRMLVAQAQAEGLTLVTHDRLLEPYDVEILWA